MNAFALRQRQIRRIVTTIVGRFPVEAPPPEEHLETHMPVVSKRPASALSQPSGVGSTMLLAGWLAATSFFVRRVVRNYR